MPWLAFRVDVSALRQHSKHGEVIAGLMTLVAMALVARMLEREVQRDAARQGAWQEPDHGGQSS